jgi:hypothetical protein
MSITKIVLDLCFDLWSLSNKKFSFRGSKIFVEENGAYKMNTNVQIQKSWSLEPRKAKSNDS